MSIDEIVKGLRDPDPDARPVEAAARRLSVIGAAWDALGFAEDARINFDAMIALRRAITGEQP